MPVLLVKLKKPRFYERWQTQSIFLFAVPARKGKREHRAIEIWTRGFAMGHLQASYRARHYAVPAVTVRMIL
jgi:hypothetical protein